jgi:hypothetical protein
LSGLLECLCVIPFHLLSLLPALGRRLVFVRHAYLVESGVNHGNRLTFRRAMILGDPSMRMFDDGAGMHEYLLCTVVVPASDPKDLFVEHGTMFTRQSHG